MKIITGKDILEAQNDLARIRMLIQIIKHEVKYISEEE